MPNPDTYFTDLAAFTTETLAAIRGDDGGAAIQAEWCWHKTEDLGVVIGRLPGSLVITVECTRCGSTWPITVEPKEL